MILLDTHAFVWWTASPDRLSERALAAISGAREIGVAAISCWEVAMLVHRGRLTLDRDVLVWLRQALAQPRVCYVGLTPEIAAAAAALDRAPADPADRMLIASALQLSSALVTRDAHISARIPERCVW